MQKLEAKTDGKSMDVVSDNINQLRELFPEVFTEGKIDFDTLKELLGEYVDDCEERYSFNWNGKSQARMIAQTPSSGTLRPCPEESIDWSTTQNLFIEGDNLEVLKLLQKAYYKKVKMIYLDPPYNTGDEFIYPDKYQDNLTTYLRYTGQIDDAGFKLSTNSETLGRYHTNWLNMMYSRLKLARNLLRDDGVIFISIDDNEVANLKKICDEIFGEENFEGTIHWRRRHNQPNDPTKMIGLVAEYILSYSKDKAYYKQCGVGKIELTGSFSNPDNDLRGEWATKPWKAGSDQSGSRYNIMTPTGKIFDEEWMGEEETFKELVKDNRIIWPKNGEGAPRKKYFKSERESEGQCATNWWPHDRFGHNQGANDEMTKLMGMKNVFSNPKPASLIKNLIAISNCKEGDIVLDFFAGSCTTFQAAVDFDENVKCICVQLPELLDPKNKNQINGYEFCQSHSLIPTIAEIGKERIRRVIADIKENYSDYKGDLGFKVFKLDSTNIKPWDVDENNLQTALEDYITNIKDGRSENDVLYEIMLKYGLDLTLPVEEKKIAGKTVFVIGAGALIICLDDDITLDVVEGIVKLKEELQPEIVRIVFKDLGFKGDVVKTNALQILKLAGIDDVKSI